MAAIDQDTQRLITQVAAEADQTVDDETPYPPGASTRPNRPRSVTVATRLSPDDLVAVEALADRLDVPVSALVRGWVLAGLAASRRSEDDVHSAIERLSADVQRLRELVA